MRTVVGANGAPLFGMHLGTLESVGLGLLAGEWRRSAVYRFLHHKSWRWCMVANAEIMVAFVLLDAGYATNAFVFAVDLASRRLLVDHTALGLPRLSIRVGDRPNEGSEARFAAQGLEIAISRPVGQGAFHVSVEARDLMVDAELETRDAPPGLVLIAPVPGGTVNVTQKTSGLAARGTVRVDGATHDLTGGYGGFDYTSGLLARHTAWRWAFATGRTADGRSVGLNLVEGFNETGTSSENVLWVDGVAVPVGRARFHFDAHAPLAPWTITTDDHAVELGFEPIAAHREDRDLVVARSHFVQVAGTFTGTVRLPSGATPIARLPGVTEDQDVLW